MLFEKCQDNYSIITFQDSMFLVDFGYHGSLFDLEQNAALSRVYLGDLSGVILASKVKVSPEWLKDFKAKYPWVNLLSSVT